MMTMMMMVEMRCWMVRHAPRRGVWSRQVFLITNVIQTGKLGKLGENKKKKEKEGLQQLFYDK